MTTSSRTDDATLPIPFWRNRSPAVRFGWSTLTLIPMWIVVLFVLALCLLIAVPVIVLGYPFIHYMWGMQPDKLERSDEV